MATENPILPAPEEQVSKAAEDVQKATSEVTPEVPDSETAATAEPETPAAAQGEPAASAAEAPVSEAPAEETVAETAAEAPAAGEAAAEAPADGKGAPAEVPAAEVPAAEVVAEAPAAETAAEAAPAEETARAKRARIKPAAEAVVTETEEEAAASDVQVDFADEEAALAAQDAGLELEGETAEEAEAEQMAGSAADTEDKFTGRGKEELVALFTRMLEEQPVQSIRRDVEALKIAFYRIRRAEVEAARRKFIEEGGAEEDFAPAVDGVEVQLKELFKEYRRRRDEFIANLEAEKEKNLQVKLGIIEELKELVNSDETLNHTFTKFRELQQRWKETGIVPQQNVKDLWETYNLHVENFYNFIKINKELRDLDLKKNYEQKVALCEQAEALDPGTFGGRGVPQIAETPRRVARDGSRGQRIQGGALGAFQGGVEPHQQTASGAFRGVEGRAGPQSRTENGALRRDRGAGRAAAHHPQGVEPGQRPSAGDSEDVEDYRFRAPRRTTTASTSVSARRATGSSRPSVSSMPGVKTEMEHNLQLKTEICEAAESLMNSEEWKKATDELIALQARWKQIGAVSRRHSDAVWKRFRAACDKFFERKASHFRERGRRARGESAEEARPAGRNGRGRRQGRRLRGDPRVPAPLGRDRVRAHQAEGRHAEEIQGRRRCAVQHAARHRSATVR